MGFEVYEGTEIETDYYNFTALNTPQRSSGKRHAGYTLQPLHPNSCIRTPRHLQATDTCYGSKETTNQRLFPLVRYSVPMMMQLHSPMFTQMEGLVVDKGITLCDLKGMLDELVKKIFGKRDPPHVFVHPTSHSQSLP